MDVDGRSHHDIKRMMDRLAGIESLPYLLLGIATFGVGTLALARWALGHLEQGRWLPATGVVAASLAAPALLFALVRRGRRFTALAVVMMWLGFVAYGLAEMGYALPAAWLP